MSAKAKEAIGWLMVAFLLVLIFADNSRAADGIPHAAYRYQRDLIGNARAVWGLNAPVATFAGQVEQESGWNPGAKSAFAGGLAQFTPATADWISKTYASELGKNEPYNPAWALRALVRYDKHLWDAIAAAETDCDHMAFTLASYNAGPGWIDRERRRAPSPGKWWNSTESVCLRATASCAQSRDYSQKILKQREPKYLEWGAGSCNAANL